MIVKFLSHPEVFDFSGDWYIKGTDERVVLKEVTHSYYDDRDEIKILAVIEFVSDYPKQEALQLVAATGKSPTMLYSGHPVEEFPRIWTALVDMKLYLSRVPFGTKAAEVLFGKRE